jgi:hypothetical protein
MSKTAVTFFTLLLVLASCYTAGCSLPLSPGTPSSSEKSGLSSGQGNAGIPGKLPLEDALGFIFSSDWSGPENAAAVTGSPARLINYIHGVDLDEQGYASTWMIVVETEGKSSMVTVSSQGSSTTNAPAIPTWTEINTDQILYPRELIEKNRALIFNTSQSGTIASRSLSLEEGNYIVTLSGRNTQQTLVFNATTGVLIP